jgi:DNA-binding GntR family transcriptional regulator
MRNQTLSEIAYLRIKNGILTYQLKPGISLKIEELASLFEMSTTPIREALNKLDQEQLIEHIPKRSFVVKGLDVDEISDMYDVRMALESLSAQQAAKRQEQSSIGKMELLLNRIGGLIKDREDAPIILQLEKDFHIVLMEASRNRYLVELGRRLLDRMWTFVNIKDNSHEFLVGSHKAHMEIYNAIKEKNSRKARDLAKKHIILAKQHTLSTFRNGKSNKRTFLNYLFNDKLKF